MSNDLVAYSRAGDIFHYRWAARRCLRLIHPSSSLRKIVIEGSSEKEKAGEYVIDVTEYSEDSNNKRTIRYYQLKHTTVQKDNPFMLSDLKDTITGFANRFAQHKNENTSDIISNISFYIITNRKIADTFKQKLFSIAKKEVIDNRFKDTIEKYTALTGDDLVLFCKSIILEDGEGDYIIQKDELKIELSQLVAGSIDNAQINNLVALVQEKVLPDSNNEIKREDILKRFGITSERELYPAPAIWESLESTIKRQQHDILIDRILNSIHPAIVHAAGGVGKSVFCRQLQNSLPEGSLGIAYDCFGAGNYRNRSESRHRHRDALVQIANELSSKGLCDPLIVQNTTLDEDIIRRFLLLIDTAVKTLKKVISSAQLFIFIDAADNAEMAAKEFNQPCFAHELLRERIPEGCKLVFLCRTERISLLQPNSNTLILELNTFTEHETVENLRKWFPNASKNDGIEFHRLTGGNPRVQANALDGKYESINELLSSLGPSGTSVEKQIELQLEVAVSKTKESLPEEYRCHIDSICLGLASLSPHIPIDVLAKAAEVSIDTVKSFVSDIGRSLWLSDTSVQFRDEPTETWFRNTFLATPKNYEAYINSLEPIANESSYVAEVLPQLYLQAEQYEKLIEIALSDDYLPKDNPIDARNIRVQRLQFAFKAALKSKHMNDAVKLAMRAGEEMAGNQRQLTILQDNIDLIPLLQGKEKVQEIAFKRLLNSGWDGSENVYSASLLSGIKEYRGEARGYLRSSLNWMSIFFEEKRKRKTRHIDEDVTENDFLELAYAHLNVFDVETCLKLLSRFRPINFIFTVVQYLTERLVDLGRFEEIEELICLSERNPYFIVAATSELIKVGKVPEADKIETCLKLLCSSRYRIVKPHYSYDNRITSAIISFLEACLYRNLSEHDILRVLRHYTPIKASRIVYDSHFSNERIMFLRALSIKMVISGKSEIDLEEIYPNEFSGKKKYDLDREVIKLKEVVDKLLPWFLLRAKILYNKDEKLISEALQIIPKEATRSIYSTNDRLSSEIAEIYASILVLSENQNEATEFYHSFLQNNKTFSLPSKLNLLRAAYRNSNLSDIRQDLESIIYEFVRCFRDDTPEDIADQYISLARAVLVESIDDARAYFDEAVNVISKFGDEIVQRWNAIVSLAKRSCETGKVSNKLAYRFVRCAELVGENVAREKYWDRSEAMRVTTKMSSGIGVSALSRWRDRDIGDFESELEAVLFELVESDEISPTAGWALTRFFSYHTLNNYLSACLDKESSYELRQSFLNDAVHLLQIEGTSNEYWEKLKDIADQYNLNSQQLDNIIAFYKKQKNNSLQKDYNDFENKRIVDSVEKNWDIIFDGLEIHTLEGFEELVLRFKALQDEDELNWHMRGLMKETVSRIGRNQMIDFINVILLSEYIDYYDAMHVISILPKECTNKISFKKQWPNIVFRLGQRYAYNLTSKHSFDYFVTELNIDQDLVARLKEGILSGLESGAEFADSNDFFGFVELASSSLEVIDSIALTDYSLSRFELHIDKDFGDGTWEDWLSVPNDINKNIAGFIWSALGSPKSVDRWNAVHCVRKLAELNCIDIIDELVWWLEYDKVGAFGSKQFPFYNLHARQYLFIALARISLEKPEVLVKHSTIFSKYALSEPHILIQKYASESVLNIEKRFTNTYDKDTLITVHKVGESSFDIRMEDYNYITNSYWHENNEIDTSVDYNFGWDFDQYWYKPLGDVFGVPGDQIQDLAANVIVNEWKIASNGGYSEDPRVVLWDRYSNERSTWHDHGSYPLTDNLSFYLSYHAMFVVAAKLFEKMPIIKARDWYENEWDEWLSRHLLTMEEGKWLYDNRGALPLKRPKWITEERNDTWLSNITEDDFIDGLKTKNAGDLWLNVKGGWNEKNNGRTESFSIFSALVSKKTSGALLRALATCNDPYNYKLPAYGESDMEIDDDTFVLKGWIKERSLSSRLDKSDPYANDITYPPYSLGDKIIELTDLTVANDGKLWYDNETHKVSLICEAWSSHRQGRDEEPDQSGITLKATLSFLIRLCQTFDCDIILDIGIHREIYSKYDRKDREYTQPQHKIFILSADGKLKTTGADFQLR